LVVRGLKAANKVDNAVDAERIITHTGNFVTKYGDDTGEALAKMSSDVEAMGIIGKNPGATGSLKHTEFGNLVEEWAEQSGKTNIYVEQSIDKMGRFVKGNPPGSKRPDVLELGDDGIARVYDLKTGGAKLTNSWMNDVSQNLFKDSANNKIEYYVVKEGRTKLVKTMTRG
jgi:hypothetical protein